MEEIKFTIEFCLEGLIKEIEDQCALFELNPFPFDRDSLLDLIDYESALSGLRSSLEKSSYPQLFFPNYDICMNLLGHLEEKVYRFNPKGGLN